VNTKEEMKEGTDVSYFSYLSNPVHSGAKFVYQENCLKEGQTTPVS